MTFKHTLPVLLALVFATASFGAQQPQSAHRITANRAAQIAVKKYKGKLQGTPKLEHEDGKWQYEVLIRSGKLLKEVNVDAVTGKIGSVENTSAKEEARERVARSHSGKAKKKKGS